LEVKLIDEGFKNVWNDYVINHKYSVAWQCYEWSEVVKKHYKTEFYPLAAFDGSTITGILPLYKVNNTFLSVAYAVAGGLLSDNDEIEEALINKSVDLAKKENVGKIVFKQYKKKINQDLTLDSNFYNRELDISASIDNIWNNLDEKNKMELSDLKENEYSLDFSPEQVDLYYDILFNHLKRNGIPCESKKWIKDLIDFKMYNIATLKKNGKVLSCTMTKKFKSTVSFPFSCTLGNDRANIRNLYILYWLLIKRYSQDGLQIFHSGRIPKTNEADIHRLGWGGTKFEYFYQYYPKTNGTTEFSSKRGIKRKVFNFIWKVSPKFLVKSVSGKIITRFP
jgi:hypothetical protein